MSKAYHRYWAEGRSLAAPTEDIDVPLWAKGVAVLIVGVLYCAVIVGAFLVVAHVWFKLQTAHIDWCAEAGGKMRIGAFYYVSCYVLTPKKQP